MSSVINNFIQCSFDMNTIDKKEFINDNDILSISTIFRHKFMKYNIVLHNIWYFFFKTYAPSCISHHIMKDITQIQFSLDILNIIFSHPACKIIKQISGMYNMNECLSYIKDIIANSDNETFIKEFLIKKLCIRFGVDFEISMLKNNVLKLFIILSENPNTNIDYNINPISKHMLNDLYYKPLLIDFPYDIISGIVFQDRHFLFKLINECAICIDDTVDIDKHIILTLLNTLKSEGISKKPVVFIIKNDENHGMKKDYINELKQISHIFEISTQLYNLLPCISNKSIVISNREYPSLKPLCRSKTQAIYYLRAWEECNIIHSINNSYITSYDRCITNIPFSYKHPILKTYRIFDFFQDIPPSTKHSHKKVLIASGSVSTTMIKERDETVSTDVYYVNMKYRYYDKIIDIYNEIPIKHIYGYILCNTNIECNRKTFPISIFTKLLFSKSYFQRMWVEHSRYSCPYNNTHPYNNILELLEFMIQYIEYHTKSRKSNEISKLQYTSEATIVLIDSRPNPLSILSFLLAIFNVKTESWSGKVYTSHVCKDYYEQYLSSFGVQIIIWHELETEIHNIDTYNTMLKNVNFWKSIGGTNALIIQDDGMLLRNGIETYFDVDYIGAPWVDSSDNTFIKNNINNELVGNGGFSLRNIKSCIDICENCIFEKYLLFYDNQVEIPEDVYFVLCLKKKGYKVGDKKRALSFSCEQILTESSLGMHKAWVYNTRDSLQAFYKTFLI